MPHQQQLRLEALFRPENRAQDPKSTSHSGDLHARQPVAWATPEPRIDYAAEMHLSMPFKLVVRPRCEPMLFLPRLKTLEARQLMWDAPSMTITVDSKRRAVLPNVKPGDRFEVEFTSDGKLIFTPLVASTRKISYVCKDGLILGVTNQPITWEETRQAMDEFP
jgi:hypothetical protein